jgi:hypothetical protein
MTIDVGLEMIEHAIRNPGSEVRRVAIRIIENHLAKRPDDRHLADLLAQLTQTKRQRISSIIEALQARGERLDDEDLEYIQSKTDALRRDDIEMLPPNGYPTPPPSPA